MPKLGAVVAVESGLQSRWKGDETELHKLSQKTDLFEGFTKTFKPITEDGEQHSPQKKIIQLKAEDVFKLLQKRLGDLFDNTATKDFGNTVAKADIVVGDIVLLAGAPPTFLIWLEKQLANIHTFISKVPTLDPSEEWNFVDNLGVFRSSMSRSHRNQKRQRPIVKYDATPEHPAQTEMITEDVLVGHWEQVRVSGALPLPKKRALLDKVERLQKATKFAREEANTTDVSWVKAGEKIFSWIFAE